MIGISGALFAFGAVSLYSVVQSAPALVQDLRLDAPQSDWRPRSNAALFELYDNSRYLRERADAFLRAMGEEDTQVQNALTSLDLALQGVEAAPADAYAWTLLAAASVANGLDDTARVALAHSRILAPYNMSLAFERIALAWVEEMPLSEDVRTGLARDVAVAERFRPDMLRRALEDYPEIAAVVETLPAMDDTQDLR